MIGVDTNVVVRLLVKDDTEQFRRSYELFQKNKIFICNTVILEVEWVLRFAYQFQLIQINQALKQLFGLPNTYLADANIISTVLQWHESGLDFADAFHLVQSQHCSQFYTFEQKFLRKAQQLSNCKLEQP